MRKWIISHGGMFQIILWTALAIQIITIILRICVFEKYTVGYNVMIIIWAVCALIWVTAFVLSLLSSILINKKSKSKYYNPRVKSFSWSEYDHCHFCIAAQILNDKDFEIVCPHSANVEFIGTDDVCDCCKYAARIDFNSNKRGERSVNLYVNDRIIKR